MPEPKKRRGESTTDDSSLPSSAPLVLTPYPPALAGLISTSAASMATPAKAQVGAVDAASPVPLSSGNLRIQAPSSTPIDLLGAFEDDYELGDELGRGAMSIVRRARHRVTGEWRAVKIVDTGRFRLIPGYTIEHVLSEVRILRELNHPCIIRVYGAYEGKYLNKNALFILTELAPGGELFNSLVSAGNFSEPQARHVMWQALQAVSYLHSRNIIHRDLKPENLLVVSTTAVSEADPVVRSSHGAVVGGSASPLATADAAGGDVMIPMLNIKVADFGTARYLGDVGIGGGATTFVGEIIGSCCGPMHPLNILLDQRVSSRETRRVHTVPCKSNENSPRPYPRRSQGHHNTLHLRFCSRVTHFAAAEPVELATVAQLTSIRSGSCSTSAWQATFPSTRAHQRPPGRRLTTWHHGKRAREKGSFTLHLLFGRIYQAKRKR